MPGRNNRNAYLHRARQNRNDEFYTQYNDIQREINAYIEYNPNVFRDKTILLPCDDPEWSNFTKFFAQNFENFGIKKLISTSYAVESKNYNADNWQPTLFEQNNPLFNLDKTRRCGKIFTLTKDNSRSVNINDLKWEYLEGNGDFRSEEVKKLRDESDIICTNPPFSLFREFLAWIVEANKQFIIIGNQNAIGYKDIFPLLKEDKIWLGNGFKGGAGYFISEYDDYATAQNHINGMIRVSGVIWFTNIEHGKRHQPLQLMTMKDNLRYSRHNEIRNKTYKTYYNYDAIDVPFVESIPSDYNGDMGVPITFMDKYCPEQFEIIGLGIANLGLNCGVRPYTREHKDYRKNIQRRGAVDGDLYMIDDNNHPVVPYSRILIRKRN